MIKSAVYVSWTCRDGCLGKGGPVCVQLRSNQTSSTVQQVLNTRRSDQAMRSWWLSKLHHSATHSAATHATHAATHSAATIAAIPPPPIPPPPIPPPPIPPPPCCRHPFRRHPFHRHLAVRHPFRHHRHPLFRQHRWNN